MCYFHFRINFKSDSSVTKNGGIAINIYPDTSYACNQYETFIDGSCKPF